MYEEDKQRKIFGNDSTTGLFVSLYLILIAFFLVLNSMSTLVETRQDSVIESVASAFSAKKNTTRHGDTEDGRGLLASGKDETLNKIQSILRTDLSLEGDFPTQSGDVYTVEIPVDYLFERGSLKVRNMQHTVIENMVRVLTDTEPGVRKDVTFLFGTGTTQITRDFTRSQEIAVRRAGSLARILRELQLQDGTFSVGFSDHDEQTIVAVFHAGKMPTVSALLEPMAETGQ